MQERARKRVMETLADDAKVLDVGGWAVPFPRADWVIDLFPFQTRGEWGYEGDRAQERFSADTWVTRDICDHEPWPFEDKFFDFVICSQTLEDVRDPIWVCAEMVRIAKGGYIEVPSRLVEQSWGVHGQWVGWGHHHWIVDIDEAANSVDFVFKHHIIHAPGPDHFAEGFFQTLTPEQRGQTLWWEGSFDFRERVFTNPAELHTYLRDFVAANGPPGSAGSR